METNTKYTMMLIPLLFVYVSGFFIAPHWLSYLGGSILMYLMSNLAYSKLKKEAEAAGLVPK